MNEFSFHFHELNISIDDFTSFIKDEDQSVNEIFTGMIGEILSLAPHICSLKGGYEIFDFEQVASEKQFRVDSQVFNTGKIVYSQLKKSEKAALFVCTAGNEISAWSKEENFRGDMLKSYLIDLAGSVIVEAAVDRIHEMIGKEAGRKGLKITNRYSPGYCNWDVAEQFKLFSLLPENFCGVTLTDSALMQPVKSVSGMIGIGKDVKKNDYTCSACTQENCIFSNKKRNPGK